MTRRDRTTGLPRRREREQAHSRRSRFSLTEGTARFAILGAVAVLLLLVVGLIGYNWYNENHLRPGKTILTVDGETYSLQYFTDRLPAFAQANPSLVAGIRERSLLTKIEDEAMAIKLAEAQGIDISDGAVTAYIAEDLGTEPGGSGSTYDTLYRQRLRQTGLSDGDYRDLSRAALANEKLVEGLETEVGDAGEQLTLRVVVTQSEEEAQAALARIEGGEDMGTVAQDVSEDLTSKQEDGLLTPTPRELFPESVKTAIAEQDEGGLTGPLQVNNGWWLIRVEEIDPDATYTDAIRTQLANLRLGDVLNEAKTTSEIERDFTDSDIDWAYRNLKVPGS